jgi:hypothetical protein
MKYTNNIVYLFKQQTEEAQMCRQDFSFVGSIAKGQTLI